MFILFKLFNFISGKAFFIFEWIKCFDLNNGPIISKIFPPIAEDNLNLNILDLCSGTGNIAYEFCSRGAKRVYAVDKGRRCIKYIKETKEALNMPIQPLQSEVISFVENTHQTYDIIFADPPYEMDFMWFEQLIKHVFYKSLINSGGICIVEHSKHTNLSNLDHFDKSKTYGGNCFSFFEKKADL